MLFNSYIFIFLFLPFTVALYFCLGTWLKGRAAALWLLCASLVFYGWWKPSNILIIIGSSLVNYGLAWLMNGGASIPFKRIALSRQSILILGLSFNVALLGYFKYSGFVVENLNAVFALNWSIPERELPLGISFFTFTQMAYLVDTYRDRKFESNWFSYALFVTFFPQLIAGPIVHHRSLAPQFWRLRIYCFNAENFAAGLTIFILGLAKKVLLADNIAGYASPVFQGASDTAPLTFFAAWGGALAYTLQLYFDFSGYSDMAVGLSKLFNIWVPENFNSPYKASSIIDFWKRWHITLSNFLRDYLYIPLGGNRKGSARRYLNLLVAMLLGGLWHGAGWTFVLWGGLHGVYLVINHGWRRFYPRYSILRAIAKSRLWQICTVGLTFLAVVVAWVFFRSESLAGAMAILNAMSGAQGVCLPGNSSLWGGACGDWLANFGDVGGWIWIGALLGIAWFAPTTQQLTTPYYRSRTVAEPETSQRFRFSMAWAAGLSLLAALCIVRLSAASEFLYFAF